MRFETYKNLKVHKLLEPDETHLQVLRKLADEVPKPSSIIFEKSWQLSEVPTNWERGNTIPIFKKGQNQDLGNHRSVRLLSLPGKIMKQILLETMLKHMGKKVTMDNSQHVHVPGHERSI